MSLFVGLMSGTSIDAIDAVLVDFSASKLQLLHTYTHFWQASIRNQLLQLSQQHQIAIHLDDFARFDHIIAEEFAYATLALLKQANIATHEITAIGCAGQTLYHSPNTFPPYTIQLGNPNVIAEITTIPTVADFRRRDIAAGGQGAPLAPAFHNAYLRSEVENRAVVNIGGIANVTILPTDMSKPVIGFDTGVGNALLDAWSYQQRQVYMDENGIWAGSGQVDKNLLNELLNDPYFAQSPPKSTGRDYFNLTWLEKFLTGKTLKSEDVQATLTQLTIQSIADAIQSHQVQRVLICGGGVHNPLIMQGLQTALPNTLVESTAHHGIDPDWLEAMCFAWLAKQRLDNKPSNLPSVTGAKQAVILGGIY